MDRAWRVDHAGHFPGGPPSEASGLTVFEWAADPALLVQDSNWEHDFDLVYTRIGVEPVA
jgi:hypothetical protein